MTCPSCESTRIVIVLSDDRRSFCTRCGTRWKARAPLPQEQHPSVTAPVPGDEAS
jgi:uncharacterized paraquat-inducible protein A